MAGSDKLRRKFRCSEPLAFFGGLVAMFFLFGLFVSRYCAASSAVRDMIPSTGSPTGQTALIPASLAQYPGTPSTEVGVSDVKASLIAPQSERSSSGETTLGADFYLSQVTAFYQNMIAWLFAIIGAILALNYLYLRASSRTQAEEMAAQALEHSGFEAQLEKKIKAEVGRKWARSGTANINADIEEMKTIIDEMRERIEFVEKSVTTKSYEALKEPMHGGSEKDDKEE